YISRPLILIVSASLFRPLPVPLPRGYHWLLILSQRAIWLAFIPPASVKYPPTYTLLPSIAITFTPPTTPLLAPLPNGCHWLLILSPLPMPLTVTPPASVKSPPAYT